MGDNAERRKLLFDSTPNDKLSNGKTGSDPTGSASPGA
ncbi:hypothetical protein VTH82DRAFT_7152 [Thermothelomyces myriococcoides]